MTASSGLWRHSRSMEAAVLSRLSGTSKTLELMLGARRALLALRPRPRCTVSPLLNMHVTGELDGAPVHLFMPPTAFDWCIDTIAPELAKADLDPATAALLFEAALAEPLDRLEAALGSRLVIQKAEICREKQDAWTRPDLVLRAEIPGRPPFAINACVPSGAARKVLALWAAEPDDAASVDPDVTLAVRIGIVKLPRAERDGLQAGDLVMLDECSLLSKQVCLIADETLGAMAAIDGRTIRLLSPLERIAGSWIDRLALRKAGGSRLLEAVTLTAELARRRMPFSELETIDFGQPFTIPHGIDGAIDLYSGPERFASGHLVMAGGAIGVRVAGVYRNG